MCYQFNIISSSPFNSQSILINAINGNVVEQYSTFSNAAGDACTHYSGNTQITTSLLGNDFILYDNQKNVHTYSLQNLYTDPRLQTNPEFKDPNDLISSDDWTCSEWMNSQNDHYALDAHWAALMTYDYFNLIHNRNGYDNQGSVLDVYVHHGQKNYAAWLGTNLSPVGSVFGMAFGDGNGSVYDALVSLDIIAHEFGHAITQFTSNLKPTNVPGAEESGSINEGLSDIWGAVVENWVISEGLNGTGDNDKDVWLAGEEVRLNTVAERSLRDPKGFFDPLSNPIGSSMADTYNGANYSGLRGKSGVLSHWFYLLSVGSAATDGINDNSVSFNFSGIGIEKAADIVYLAQTVYFTELTNYVDARQSTLQAAKDLYGTCSQEAEIVSAAWDAVGVPVFSLQSLPIFAACGEINTLNQPTGVYDGLGYGNIVVAKPSDGGVLYSGVNTFCNNFTEIVVQNGSNTIFKASDRVILEPGFKAEKGSNFRAYIFNCSNNSNLRQTIPSNNEVEPEVVYANNISEPQLYPNPTDGVLNVNIINDSNPYIIEVYNLMGKQLLVKNISQQKAIINLNDFSKGIYIVKTTIGNATYVNKVVYH